MGDLVPIYSAANLVQAELLREELAQQGISAWIINEALSGAVGEVPPGWSSNPRVVVATEDAERARELALAFEQQARAAASARSTKPEYISPVVDQDAWPRCPVCGEKRLAVCRICGTAGTTFPPAYQPGHADAERPLMVVCPTCDEPFVPRFYKECEHCNYEFDEGVSFPKPVPDEELLKSDLRRVWLVIGGMAALFAASGLYLAWLMSQETTR